MYTEVSLDLIESRISDFFRYNPSKKFDGDITLIRVASGAAREDVERRRSDAFNFEANW